jgi:hypothetical protein
MEVKFEMKDRDGKKSLWVNDYNIWDLTAKELTPDVKKAICHAYFLGIEQYKRNIQDMLWQGPREAIGDSFKQGR